MLIRSVHRSQWMGISALASVVFLTIAIRFYNQQPIEHPPSPLPVIVEVQTASSISEGGKEKDSHRTEINNPGVHLLAGSKATVSQALQAAGACLSNSSTALPEAIASREIHTGDLLLVSCSTESQTIRVYIKSMSAAARLTLGIKLDVNAATQAELNLVPGMRPQFAQAIVNRRDNKTWHSLEELEEISGVGPKTVAKWKNYLEIVPF